MRINAADKCIQQCLITALSSGWCILVECSSLLFFFFKQKTAYEMRISDWSSDVCSSDLQEETVDTYALAVAENALKTMRAFDEPGSKYHGLAKALKNAIRVDPDPEYFTRIHRLRLKFEADVRNRYASQGNPHYPPGVDRADRKSTRLNSSH